jgi:hypothetical protein
MMSNQLFSNKRTYGATNLSKNLKASSNLYNNNLLLKASGVVNLSKSLKVISGLINQSRSRNHLANSSKRLITHGTHNLLNSNKLKTFRP